MKIRQPQNFAGALAPLFAGAAFLSLGLTGCSHTLNGAQQDVSTDAQKTSAAAQQAGQDVSSAAHNADAAVAVTPEVKTAIIRDPVLNDPRNLVNVTSTNHQVHLRGHVMSADMKTRATEDAQTVLTKRHPNYTVVDELTVAGGRQ